MKRMLKKALAFLMGLVVSLSLLCGNTWMGRMSGGMLQADAMTRSEFDSKLSSLRSAYPNYSTWTGSYHGGRECFGFARLIADQVFGGDSCGWPKSYDIAGVKPGDILQYGDTRGNGHTVFVTAVSGDTITFVDCNGNGNGYHANGSYDRRCGILWDNTINKWSNMYPKSRNYSFSYRLVSPDIIDIPTISGGSRTISDGDYHIVSALTGTILNPGPSCLTIGGLPGAENTDGASAQLWAVLGGEDHVFTVTWLDNGFYKIKLKNSSSKCLDVDNAALEWGTNVQQWEDNGTFAQQWRIDVADDGYGYKLISRCNGLCLDVNDGKTDDGTNIKVWPENGSNAQRWYFVPWGGGDSAQQEMPDGEYHIVPRTAPDKALNVEGNGVTNGTNIILWSCRDDGRHTFQVKWLGNGYYKIINQNSRLSLDVADGKSWSETNVQLYEENNTAAQQWLIKSCGGGYYNIISKLNGLYLDLTGAKTDNGTNIQMYVGWGINGGEAQKWRFIPWGESIGQTIEDGKYQIVPQADDGKVIGAAGDGTENGTNIELNDNKGNKEHTFDITYLGNGYYSIVNRNSNLSLNVDNAGMDSGTNVQLWDMDESNAQQWIIKSCGDGYYNIISKCNGLYLDLANGNTDNGTNIWMWGANQTNAQKWKFVPYVEVEKITLNKKTLTISAGTQVLLKATVSPANVTDATLTWESSDTSVAEVDENGVVTTKSAGTATITAKTSNGKTASCQITVVEDGDMEEHSHVYGSEWKSDANSHWKECECGNKSEMALHDFVWESDEEAEGLRHEMCSVCGYIGKWESSSCVLGDVNGDGKITTSDALAILKHIAHIDQIRFIDDAADCDKNGKTTTGDALAVLKHVARIEFLTQ